MTLLAVLLHSLRNEGKTPSVRPKIHLASPFRPVGGGIWLPSPAFSAPNDIPSFLTPPPKPNSLMARISGPNPSTTVLAPLTTKISVSTSTSGFHVPAITALNMSMSAPFVVPKATMPFLGLAAQVPTDFRVVACPPCLLYPSFLSFIHRRPSFNPSLHRLSDIFTKIVCPYNVTSFASLLDKHNLTESYPHLLHNLQHGFPLGQMPLLSSTVIIPNHPSVRLHIDSVIQYLEVEIAAGRMSGPFSPSEVKHIL